MGNPILEPVEGISCEQWAAVNAKLVAGIQTEEAIKAIGVDMPKWDRVNNEWLTRMRNDTSFEVSKVYADAFNKKAEGNLGKGAEINAESYSFEQWIELMAAQDVFSKQGRDAQDILKDFGLTVADYSNISSFWSNKMMTDFSIVAKMQPLMEEYKKKYESMAGGSSHDDIEF
jgi:hypothetical protein